MPVEGTGPARSAGQLIRTPDHRLRVFVSSTLQELLPERNAAKAAIRRLHLSPVMFEIGARPYPPRDLYRAYLEQSHIFVGIYWQRYGWVAPEEEISGLEDEYRLCGPRPKLIYVKRPTEGREPRLTELLHRIQTEDAASYKPFETAAELQRLLVDDLALLLTERFEATGPPAVSRGSDEVSRVEEAGGDEAQPAAADEVRATASHWPRATSALIGRDRELDELERLLARPDVQLLTLLGPGGIGKTRLAIALGDRLRTRQQAVFVGLQALEDAELVLPTMAEALGVSPAEGETVATGLSRALADRDTLVLLDNVEQVLGVGPALAELLIGCPRLTVVVTSRAPIRIAAEVEFVVPALEAPGPSADLADVEAAGAVELFLTRARTIRPGFGLTEGNAGAVAELVRRLDGLPLAIELAAARTKLLSPAQLLGRLDHRFDLLAGGDRDLPGRQQTLRATIDWSFDLLAPTEQRALADLGVFAGGWSLAAAEAICQPDPDTDFLERLAALVEVSLVVARDIAEEIRFGLLESVRAYAIEKLAAGGHETDVRRRHADYFSELAERARARLGGSEQQEWLARLESDHDNLRAALSWYATAGEAARAAGLAVSLTYFWWIRGHYTEGRHWLGRVAEALPAGDLLRARAEKNLGVLAWVQGDYAAARRAYEKALPVFRQVGDQAEQASVLGNLGIIAMEHQELDQARELLNEAADLSRRLGDPQVIAPALVNLSLLQIRRREWEAASGNLAEAIEEFRRSDDSWRLTTAQINLGEVMLARGDVDRSRQVFAESLGRAHRIGDLDSVAYALEGAGCIEADRSEPVEAARMWGAAEALRATLGNTRPPGTGATSYEADVDRMRTLAGSDTFAQAWSAGRTLPLADAISAALERLSSR